MPDWQEEVRRRLTGAGLPAARAGEVADELSQHLQDRYEECLRGGSTEDAAERETLAELDDRDLAAALAGGVRDARREPVPAGASSGGSWTADLAGDLRYAVRTLRGAPGFAIVAILTLALGIGANTALFSVVDAVLLDPLPYPHAGELVVLHESKPNFPSGSISYPNFRDWQRLNRTFAAMAVYRSSSFGLTGLGEAEQIDAEFVTSDFFSMLGVTPILGRTFAAGEDDIGAAPVVLLTEGFWMRKLGGVRDVVGRSLALDGRDYTIVGVVPATHDFPAAGVRSCEVYVPIGQWTNPFLIRRTAGLGIHGIGRLKPGVSLGQARADMDAVTRALAAAYPGENKSVGATLVPFREALVGSVRPLLLVLLGAVGFVLLIACVNVANLLLARSLARQREFGIRAALGAGRARLVRQLLAESVVLAGAGAGLGVLAAAWGTRAALGALPAALPRVEHTRLDPRVLAFTAIVSIAAGVLFGLLPAFRAARVAPGEALRDGGRGASGTRHRLQAAFVVAEMAMALVLLAGAGLMIRTLRQLWSVDPGFRSDHVLTFDVTLPPSLAKQSPDAIRAHLRDLHARLEAAPGAASVSFASGALPLVDDDEELFWMEGQPRPASRFDMNWALKYVVEPGYLGAMGLTLQRGRFFTNGDREGAPRVIVIDDTLARKFFGPADPVGRRLNLDDFGGPAEIVGVVGHVKQWALDRDAESLQAQLYMPFMQMPDQAMALVPAGFGVIVREAGAAPDLFGALKRAAAGASHETILYGAQTMNEAIADTLAARRFAMMLFGAFAVLALVLASIGLFGVVSYVVGRRTHEIGVRLALGAGEGEVVRWIVGQGARLALAGVVLGLIAASGLARVMARSSLLFGITATDPPTFAAVGLLLTAVALAACYLPARRAARVDPLIALRTD